jgi:hypothetical protein
MDNLFCANLFLHFSVEARLATGLSSALRSEGNRLWKTFRAMAISIPGPADF